MKDSIQQLCDLPLEELLQYQHSRVNKPQAVVHFLGTLQDEVNYLNPPDAEKSVLVDNMTNALVNIAFGHELPTDLAQKLKIIAQAKPDNDLYLAALSESLAKFTLSPEEVREQQTGKILTKIASITQDQYLAAAQGFQQLNALFERESKIAIRDYLQQIIHDQRISLSLTALPIIQIGILCEGVLNLQQTLGVSRLSLSQKEAIESILMGVNYLLSESDIAKLSTVDLAKHGAKVRDVESVVKNMLPQ